MFSLAHAPHLQKVQTPTSQVKRVKKKSRYIDMSKNQKSRIDGRLDAGLKKSKRGICKILHKNEVDRL